MCCFFVFCFYISDLNLEDNIPATTRGNVKIITSRKIACKYGIR